MNEYLVICTHCEKTIKIQADDNYMAHLYAKEKHEWMWLGGTVWSCPECKYSKQEVIEITY